MKYIIKLEYKQVYRIPGYFRPYTLSVSPRLEFDQTYMQFKETYFETERTRFVLNSPADKKGESKGANLKRDEYWLFLTYFKCVCDSKLLQLMYKTTYFISQ